MHVQYAAVFILYSIKYVCVYWCAIADIAILFPTLIFFSVSPSVQLQLTGFII